MPKCDNCDKTIPKRSPMLECNKCSKLVHANQVCTGLSAKQLSALRNTENLEWTCEECRKESPRRKSFITQEEEEEEDEATVKYQEGDNDSIALKKLISDISSEVKKAVKKEISSVNEAINHCCKKMDDMMETIEVFNGRIKELEKKNTYLINQNKHLELKVDAMEQYIGLIEQKQLNNVLEIAGVPESKSDNPENICFKIAAKINTDVKNINVAKRLRGKNGQEGVIQVILHQEEQVDQWIRAARKESIKVEDIASIPDPAAAKSKVILRRALSSANKTLLWQAKLKLKDTHKYIWFQGGRILVRKNDNDKPIVIKNFNDIEKITTQKNSSR